MYRIHQIVDFKTEVLRDRAARGLPTPAACLWCFNTRLLHGGLSLWRDRGGELLIEAELASGMAQLRVNDAAEAHAAAALLAAYGLYFNDNDPR